MNALWNIIPSNPVVTTVELPDAEIVAMLEAHLERTFAADPFKHGRLREALPRAHIVREGGESASAPYRQTPDRP